ncbi:hypothetical protein WL95_27440 [Burkholderia cepacia]|nr:hypothetical protein WL95_27440 [Burkholderia cepacia]
MGSATLHLGDCRDVLKTIADASVDAIVTDPPYELGFMGRAWDRSGIAYDVAMWAECLRVLKPGGHLLAFSGSRTYHRMACAIEDAGFELRDQIMWIYGSGFPKSRNLGGDWNGWGTALKPAHEPICVARKPLVGTVAANVLEHGTGALNIDACRVSTDESTPAEEAEAQAYAAAYVKGRWPANVIHDGSPEVLDAFAQFGVDKGQAARLDRRNSDKTRNTFGAFSGTTDVDFAPHDTPGSAARFFYCAKASRADRNEGCDALPDQKGGMNSNTSGQHITRRDGWEPEPVKNNHPTVKPTELMAYLCRLVTPPGGVVLDPFMGSGSTGKACAREGFAFVGIDVTPEYVDIARSRIEYETNRVVAAFEVASRQKELFDAVG